MAPPAPERATVVIIGGGIIGVCCAYYLAKAGVVDVVVVERDELGSGSTSKANGGLRSSFTSPANIQMGLRGLEVASTFARDFDQEIDLERDGYLYLLTDPDDVTYFEASTELQNSLGVLSRMVSPAEAQQIAPVIRTDGLVAACWSEQDGRATPDSMVQGYARAARALGVRLLRHTEVVGIDVETDAITAVRTTKGSIATDTVVCAAGAWSAAVGQMAGVDLPVVPIRREVIFTEAIPDLPHIPSTVIEFPSTFWFHPEGKGLAIGFSNPDEPAGFNTRYGGEDFLMKLAEHAERRAPSLLESGVRSGWAGLYEVTPDHNQIIGESSGVSRFLYACGYSGHGFQMGPATGEIIRDLVLGAQPFIDIGEFALERFTSEGAHVGTERNIL